MTSYGLLGRWAFRSEIEAEFVCPRVRRWASTRSDGVATWTLASVYNLLYVKRLRA